MADIYSVLQTVTENLQTAIYPNGLMQPSVTGAQVTIEQGWPIRSQLDKDLQAGYSHVSVFPTNQERVVTKFERNFIPVSQSAATLVATASESARTVTITGTVTVPQVVMTIVNGTGYAYSVLIGDTINSIATAIAALIDGASANQNVVTIPTAYSLIARIATNYTAAQEIARVDHVFLITCWCPTPTARALLSPAIDVYMKQNYRIALADDFYAQVFYQKTEPSDMLEKQLIFRSDLYYKIQYPTTVTENFITVADPYADTIAINN